MDRYRLVVWKQILAMRYEQRSFDRSGSSGDCFADPPHGPQRVCNAEAPVLNGARRGGDTFS